jgi:hypothetical protein
VGVANSQVRPLTADVRKVFDAIAISIELVDLEASPNWSIMDDICLIIPILLKRKRVKIPLRCVEAYVVAILWVSSSGYVEATQTNIMTTGMIQCRVFFSV